MITWVRPVVLGVCLSVLVGLALTSTASRTATAVAHHPAGAAVAAEPDDVHATFAMGHGNNVYAYWRRGSRAVPWIVNVHGGYWRAGAADRPDLLAWARHEQGRGFAAFTVDYRLVPSVQWPTPQDDVEAALAWIRAHAQTFGLDPAKGFLQGASAGGLLAAIAALDAGGFAGVITMAGAVDPYDEYEQDPNAKLRAAALALHGGRDPRADPVGWQSARAAAHLGAHRMPFLVVHSRDDRTVSVATARRFADALRAAGYRVDLDIRAGRSHLLRTAAVTATADAWVDAVLR